MGNVSLYSVGKEMRKTLFKIIQVEVSQVTRDLAKSRNDLRNTALQKII